MNAPRWPGCDDDDDDCDDDEGDGSEDGDSWNWRDSRCGETRELVGWRSERDCTFVRYFVVGVAKVICIRIRQPRVTPTAYGFLHHSYKILI